MNYKSIRVPEQFVESIKEVAEQEHRSIPQQIMYWTELGREAELRKWQLEKMQIGLDQIDQGLTVSYDEAKLRIQKILTDNE